MTRDRHEIERIAAERAMTWFEDFPTDDVRVSSEVFRDHGDVQLTRVHLSSGAVRRVAIAKHYRLRSINRFHQRPRFGRVDDHVARPVAEYRGLQALWSLFGDSSSPPNSAIGAVRPLHVDIEGRTLVMDQFPGRDARALLGTRSTDLVRMFGSAGASLALAHQVDLGDAELRSNGREIDELFEQLIDFVAIRSDWSDRRVALIRHFWSGRPTVAPSLGTAHGDCAPRNLLVADGIGVAWIDGLFRSRTPIYEDVATFSTSVRLARWPSAIGTPGRRSRYDAYADAFIEGYRLHTSIDDNWLRSFEALILLDRIASIHSQHQPARSRIFRRLCEHELSTIVGDRWWRS